jgi:hypothetical protein
MALDSGIPAGTTSLENSWGYLRVKLGYALHALDKASTSKRAAMSPVYNLLFTNFHNDHVNTVFP